MAVFDRDLRKLIVKFTLFISPILILIPTLEYLVRHIPNDYTYKKEYLDRYSQNVQCLILGSSHTYLGVNPVYIDRTCFNAANVSQTLFFDLAIYEKYADHFPNLETIILPISYFTLFDCLDEDSESWRTVSYYLYFGIESKKTKPIELDIFNRSLINTSKRVYNYYINDESSITCSQLGWATAYNVKHDPELLLTGEIVAKRHTHKNRQYLPENIQYLKTIIEKAKEQHVQVILFVPPAYTTYVENLDSEQLSFTMNHLKMLAQKYDHVKCFDLLTDSSFVAEDFYDSDHLNAVGAEKLTKKLNSIMLGTYDGTTHKIE